MTIEERWAKVVSASGNAFHSKVVAQFRARQWHVMVSPYYVDSATDKAREIDLVCDKLWEFPERYNSRPTAYYVRLFVECKYINREVVFWFDGKEEEPVTEAITSQLPIFKDNIYIKEHHYNRVAPLGVAKLFSTGQSDDARGQDKEPIFLALSQCLGGMLQLGGLSPLTRPRSGTRTISARYPVILCSSFERFGQTAMAGSTAPQPIHDNFLLEVNYAYTHEFPGHGSRMLRQYALIDVVEFNMLDQFLGLLDKEMEAVKLLAG